METREEKLASWADPSKDKQQSVRFLEGAICLNSTDSENRVRISERKLHFDQIQDRILGIVSDKKSDDHDHNHDVVSNLWLFKVISLPRLRPGGLVLSIPKQVFQKIQESWNLHPRTIEVFLSNNGIFTPFYCSSSGRASLLMKVANSRSTGFDCISVT